MDTAPANPPWLFGILSLPYGISSSMITILMPYLLRKEGVPLDRIATVVAIAYIPFAWSFVYAPVVDIQLRRRTWLFLASSGTAALIALGVFLSTRSLGAVTVLLFLGAAISGLLSAANGALLTALPAKFHGQAAGWYNAGNIGGGTVGGGLAIWLADAVSLRALAACVALLIALPVLAAFRIEERLVPRSPIWPRMLTLSHDLRTLLTTPRTLAGLVFFLSPVGSSGIGNLISGIGPEYHASSNEVLLVSGIAGGLLNAFGSLVGGSVCHRVNTRRAYAACGVFSAVFAVYLAIGPHGPVTYGAGYSGYAIATGFAYAFFTALVLEVLGPRRHAAATGYALLVASGNVPIVYMTWLDGVGYKHWGASGLMSVDALANGAGGIVLFAVALLTRHVWLREPKPRVTSA